MLKCRLLIFLPSMLSVNTNSRDINAFSVSLDYISHFLPSSYGEDSERRGYLYINKKKKKNRNKKHLQKRR